MGYKSLIIAEKPSMAKEIQNALGSIGEKFVNKGEYSESENYLCTSVFGHIFRLQDIKEYPGQPEKWADIKLPFIPKPKYEYVVRKGAEKRAKAIKELFSRVPEVIHAGDADREGQIIIDIVLKKFEYRGKVTRLWLHDLEEVTILEALKERQDNSSKLYASYSAEGFCRQLADWSYGINLTTYCTVKAGTKLNVGRVISAIVGLIAERDREIRNFTPEPFWQLSLPVTDEVKIESKHKHMSKEDAQTQLMRYNSAVTSVKSIKKKVVRKNPPKLFSQTTLQNAASELYGWEASKTLALTQTLYERKLTTYPRTDSEYLSANEKDKVKSIISAHKKQEPHFVFHDKKTVFDSSKVDAHSAIIITSRTAEFSVNEDELEKCYQLIYDRFLMNFYDEDYLVDQTEIQIDVADSELLETISLSGEVMKQPGWSVLVKVKKDRILPELNEGDVLDGEWSLAEKETAPPKHYTVKTLNNTLKNPFKKNSDVDDEEDDEYKKTLLGISIGTDATRAGIIERALKEGYFSLKKKSYYIEPKGEYLYDTLKEMKIDMSVQKSVELNKAITAVRHGNETINSALKKIYEEISYIIEQDITPTPVAFDSVGECPVCKKTVVEKQNVYACSDRECKFFVPKVIAKKKISKKNIEKLLKNGSTDMIIGFESKAGKKFDAALALDDALSGIEFKFNSISDGEELLCPICNSAVRENGKAYFCSVRECDFVIWKNISGKKITPEIVKKILKSGTSGKINGFKTQKENAKKKTYSATLVLKRDKSGVEMKF